MTSTSASALSGSYCDPPMSTSGRGISPQPTTSIIDILDRVLDKGLVVAGDISISLAYAEPRCADALGITGRIARPAAGPGSTGGVIGSGASAPAGAAERR